MGWGRGKGDGVLASVRTSFRALEGPVRSLSSTG